MSRMSTMTAPSIASTSNVSKKSMMDETIDGDRGPPMIGVKSYPFNRSQQLYLSDFRALVASSIDHPYVATAGFNVASCPHDLLRGSNYDDDRMAAQTGHFQKWKSEYKKSYPYKSYIEAKNAEGSGVRSEQFQFLG